jgi:lysophospholipase L1-like esterase
MSLPLKFVLTPLLLAQALRTRQRLPKLPEPPGERHGAVGSGPLMRLLITGDSSAAGVGVGSQRQALAGQLVPLLAEWCGARVEWRLLARAGLNTAQTLHLLQREAQPAHYDIAIVCTGVNDIIDQVPSHHAVATREVLANWLRNALGVAHVVFVPMPPVHQFPGLPQPLRWISGTDARRHDRALARWAATRADVSRVEIDLQLNPGVMAEDGFHPAEPVYRQCASVVARHVANRVWPPLVAPHKEETPHDSPAARQDTADHRREPGHRPGHRAARGGRWREHRAAGQDG